VIRYGRDGGSDGFWGSFMEVVLQKLAEDVEDGHGVAQTLCT
jgi:hypothetical protein